MANEEKILEMLVQLQAGQTRMQRQMDSMQGQINSIQGQINGIQGQVNGIQGQVNSLQDDMHRVKAYLELDVEKRFDAVNEGIDMILERMVPEDRVEKLEDDVIVLKAAVRTLSRDVAELKKAQ